MNVHVLTIATLRQYTAVHRVHVICRQRKREYFQAGHSLTELCHSMYFASNTTVRTRVAKVTVGFGNFDSHLFSVLLIVFVQVDEGLR